MSLPCEFGCYGCSTINGEWHHCDDCKDEQYHRAVKGLIDEVEIFLAGLHEDENLAHATITKFALIGLRNKFRAVKS